MTNFLIEEIQRRQRGQDAEILSEIDGPKKGNINKQNLYNTLFFLLLTAMDIREQTVVMKSKELNSNAALQEKLNNELQQLQLKEYPKNASTTEIQRMQSENQEIAAQREDVQSKLISARQSSQSEFTETGMYVDYVQQDASEDSGWLKTLMSVFQVINQISQAS